MSVDNQQIKKAGLKAGVWNFSTTIINQLRNFIVSLILSRLLSPSDFGLLGMATVFVGVVETFVDFGFGASIVQAKEITKRQMSTVFFINLLMGALFAVIMFFSSNYIADFFHEERLSTIVKVLSPTFLVKALQVMPEVQFKRALNYHDPFKISITSGVISGVVGIILAYIGFGVWALIYSQITGWIISLIMQYWITRWWPSIVFKINEVKELWRFGYKFSLSVMIDQVFNKLNTILIGRFFTASLLGLYYRACSLNSLVIQYSFSSFSGVLFPTLSKYQDNWPMLRHNVLRIVQVISFLTFFFSGLMIVGAYEIITITYGYKWEGAVEFFKIIGFFSITLTIPTVLVNALMSVGRTDINLKVEIIKKIMFVIAIPIGLYFGIYGYVYATSIAALVTMPINMWSLKYIDLKMKPQIESIVEYAIPFGVLTAIDLIFFDKVLFDNNWLSLITKCGVYAIVYLGYNRLRRSEGMTAAINIVTPIFKNILRIKTASN